MYGVRTRSNFIDSTAELIKLEELAATGNVNDGWFSFGIDIVSLYGTRQPELVWMGWMMQWPPVERIGLLYRVSGMAEGYGAADF